MRLGGPVFEKCEGPDEWVAALKTLGYSAARCPVNENADAATVLAYADAAAKGDIVIAEVGAWSNPLAPDEAKRREALELCRARLDLADRIGARCCVNIAGSRGEKWDGPDARDLTDETFDMIVETTREIIDAVRPSRAYYTLEGMPWMYPDSPDSYVELIKAVDRERFAVHLDPVNWVSSPRVCFRNAELIRESFAKLGDRIRSCHAKDVRLDTRLTVHLDEVRPGEGTLDYGVFLTSAARLDPDTPLLLEHLKTPEEYAKAAAYVRSCAKEARVRIK